MRAVFTPPQCAHLLRYAREASFTDVTHLDGEGGICGRYEFCKQTPQAVEALRRALYKRIVDVCPDIGKAHGQDLESLEKRSRAAGQKRSANIFLAYGEGGFNLAHQDPYGTVFFPYQAMLMLSRRGKDFNGGEFFVKNATTGKREQVPADEGDVTLFAANKHAVNGTDFKHGVLPLKRASTGRCERFSVGIVFNLRK